MKKMMRKAIQILLTPFVAIAMFLVIGTELMIWAIGLITYLPVRILLTAIINGIGEVEDEFADYLERGKDIFGVISWVES